MQEFGWYSSDVILIQGKSGQGDNRPNRRNRQAEIGSPGGRPATGRHDFRRVDRSADLFLGSHAATTPRCRCQSPAPDNSRVQYSYCMQPVDGRFPDLFASVAGVVSAAVARLFSVHFQKCYVILSGIILFR